MPTVANICTRQGVGLSLLLPARGWRDVVPRDTSPPALPPSLPVPGQESPQQPPRPCAHPPRLCRRLRAAGATAEDESAVVDRPGLNMAARPDFNMAARPGLAVARQPGSESPGPCSVPSPRGRRTDVLGAQAGSVPLTDIPGLWWGCSPHPMPLSQRCWWGCCDVHGRLRKTLGRRPHRLPHITSLGTTAGLLFLVEVIFGEQMNDQEFSLLLQPLCFWFEAFLCHRQWITSRLDQNITINLEESWPAY